MSKIKDALGDRMKDYENAYRFQLPKRTYAIFRVDGNAFHTYCKGLEKPFDYDFVEDMNSTAMELCRTIQNAKFAFVQSDEISIFVHEEGKDSQAWFANNIQKMTSISASVATSKFNELRLRRYMEESMGAILQNNVTMEDVISRFRSANFDSRVFIMPSIIEVYNYFLWRQRDATKNSISAGAQALYSHSELESKNGIDKQELMFQKGVNWNDYDPGVKRGRFIDKVTYINGKPGRILKGGEDGDQYYLIDEQYYENEPYPFLKETDVVRNQWEVVPSPIFSEDQNFIIGRIKTEDLTA